MHNKEYKSILSPANGMNPYRGCTHGCIYCDSRSTCYQMTHDFEDIEIKSNGAELLADALGRKRKPCMISTGSMCDPYLPIEKKQCLMRHCLEHIEHYGFGISLLTKSDLVLRDMDILQRINKKTKAVVCTTLTTYDENLCAILEPNVASTRKRVDMLKTLHEAGIHTGVWLCPIVPFINDTEENLRGILDYCWECGVEVIMNFGMGMTLRDGSRQYFYDQLDTHFPQMKQRYGTAFGSRYQCLSPNADVLMKIYREECRAHHVIYEDQKAFAYLSEFEEQSTSAQLSLF